MKVVFLHPPMYPVNHEFFNNLSKYVNLYVYQFGGNNIFFDDSHFTNLEYKLKTFDNSLLQDYFIKLKTNLKKDKPQIVVSIAFWIPSLSASLLKKYFKYKYLIATDAHKYTEQNILYIKKKYRKYLCKNTDALIAFSNYSYEYLKSFCPQKEIFLSYLTVDTIQFINKINLLPEKNTIRDKLNLPHDKIILLGIGKFENRKNWEIIFHSLKLLEDKYYFILVGKGELREKYIKIINQLNINSKVKLVNWLKKEDLYFFLKASDIFVFPTLKDQFGFSVVEALSSGLPVLCSYRAGVANIIKDNYNGYRINPIDIKDIIKKIHLSTINRNELSINARKTALEFSLDKRVQEFLYIFDKII